MMADPAQGETGGKSLTSKLKAKVPHTRVKDTVKNLKSRLPGLKKHAGGDEEGHEDSSEYDNDSPRSPGPETGYNVGESTPFSGVKTTPASNDYNNPPLTSGLGSPREVHNRDSDWRPSQISSWGNDSQNRNYVAAAPPTRPAPMATGSPRSNLAPSLEEKFKYLEVGENSPRAVDPATDRSYQPERNYPPSTTESLQKGYNDVPRDSSYRASPTTPTNKGMVEKVRDSVTGAAVALGDKMGYYNDQPSAGPRDPNAPSVVDKTKAALGLDKPRDPNAPPVTEQARTYMNVASQKTREYGASAADHAAWTKDRVAAHTTPTHHDKALSEQVTQTLSTLPGTIREKVFGPASPSANSATTPGIVDRVSGAVSSLLTSSPKARQDTFPAHPDYHGQPAASSVPRTVADNTS